MNRTSLCGTQALGHQCRQRSNPAVPESGSRPRPRARATMAAAPARRSDIQDSIRCFLCSDRGRHPLQRVACKIQPDRLERPTPGNQRRAPPENGSSTDARPRNTHCQCLGMAAVLARDQRPAAQCRCILVAQNISRHRTARRPKTRALSYFCVHSGKSLRWHNARQAPRS